jgi:tetratricopeptide (TPR) repeat protein
VEPVSSDRGDLAQAALPSAAVRSTVVRSGVIAVMSLGALGALALFGSFGSRESGLRAAPAGPVSAALTREFQAGVDAYRLGKYDEARVHLDKAQAIDPKLPGPHRFLAAVAQAQHRWSDCIAETRRALQLNPRSQEVADTRKLHDDCRASDGRPAYRAELGDGAAIAVTTSVPGATVRIGGLRYGGTPMEPRQIKPGTLDLAIDKLGYKPAHVTIDALPGIVTDIAVELEAADARPAPPVRPPEPKAPSKPAR